MKLESPAPHQPSAPERPSAHRLSRNVAVLGIVSLLMGMSSAMIYGVLPVFLVAVLGASVASVGIIEGIAEATTSLTKVFSGALSDVIGRRKPLVVLGYGLSAATKLLFPLAGATSTVLIARFFDRVGKGIRDAPRDALLSDVVPSGIRGSGFGLRLTLYTIGAVLGPLAAIGLMMLSRDDFRLLFWLAVMPAVASIIVLVVGVREPGGSGGRDRHQLPMTRSQLAGLRGAFWWALSIAALLSLARFSQAFIVLKAAHVGIDAAFVPIMLVPMNLTFSASAYPSGMLADRIERRLQLAVGALALLAADLVLANAATVWVTALGAALWGLHMGATQGLLGALVADAAPDRLRGTAFGICDLAVGVATFLASAGAGALWTFGGPAMAFGAGASLAAVVVLVLALGPIPKGAGVS